MKLLPSVISGCLFCGCYQCIMATNIVFETDMFDVFCVSVLQSLPLSETWRML